MAFRRHDRELDELEARLESERPTPPPALLDRLVARVERDAPVSPQAGRASRRPGRLAGRPVFAAVFASVFLLAFAASGGIGYAKSVVVKATQGTHITFGGLGGPSGSVGNGAPSGGPTGTNAGNEGAATTNNNNWHHSGSAHHQYPQWVLVCITHGSREIPIVVNRHAADFLILHGKAHPCATDPT
jgi:hypothetical protein